MTQTAIVVATALIVAYTLAMYVKGRGDSDAGNGDGDSAAPPDLSFVFMVPCLNESWCSAGPSTVRRSRATTVLP